MLLFSFFTNYLLFKVFIENILSSISKIEKIAFQYQRSCRTLREHLSAGTTQNLSFVVNRFMVEIILQSERMALIQRQEKNRDTMLDSWKMRIQLLRNFLKCSDERSRYDGATKRREFPVHTIFSYRFQELKSA